MAMDEVKSGEPRTISKVTFGVLVFGMLVLLVVAEAIAVLTVGRALGLRTEGSLVGGLTVLNPVLARLFVEAILKRLGLSRSGKTPVRGAGEGRRRARGRGRRRPWPPSHRPPRRAGRARAAGSGRNPWLGPPTEHDLANPSGGFFR